MHLACKDPWEGPRGRLDQVDPPSPAPEGHHPLPPATPGSHWTGAGARQKPVIQPQSPQSGDRKVLNKRGCKTLQLPQDRWTLLGLGQEPWLPLHSSKEVLGPSLQRKSKPQWEDPGEALPGRFSPRLLPTRPLTTPEDIGAPTGANKKGIGA